MSVSPFRPSAALLLLLAARIAEVASPEAAENSLRATGMVDQEQGQAQQQEQERPVLGIVLYFENISATFFLHFGDVFVLFSSRRMSP